MARVRGVIARSTAAGSRLSVTRIDLRENGRRAHLKDCVGHGHKGKGRNDYLVALAHAQREQSQMQAGGAGADGYGVLHAVIRSQLRFKGRKFRAQAEVRRAQNGGDGRDLRFGNVGRGKWNVRGHIALRLRAVAGQAVASGTGCLMSKPSSGTVASTRAMVSAAVPSP